VQSGSLMGMLDFKKRQPQNAEPFVLDPETGLVKK
jgi:hypothetical protein